MDAAEAAEPVTPDQPANVEQPATPAVDTRTPFARRASNVLIAFAVFALIALLIVLGADRSGLPLVLWWAALVGVAATGLLAFLLSTALDRQRSWAPAPVAAILWLATVGGLVRFLLALVSGSLSVPLDAVLALWALSADGRPNPIPATSHRSAGWAAIGLFVAIQASTLAGAALSRPGIEPFVVGQAALTLDLHVACPAAGTAADRIPVSLRWTWVRRDLLAAGYDAVGLEAAPGPLGIENLHATEGLDYGAGGAEQLLNGTAAGTQVLGLGPPAGLVQGWSWGLDVATNGMRDGTVGLDVLPLSDAGPAPTTGVLTVTAVYARDGRWHVEREVTCSW